MVVETSNPEIRRSRKAALELMLSNHYADCIGPCQLACPAGVDIQGYIALAALDKHRDAIALIKDRNPLPAVCGRVCTRPCEVKGCRRTLLDEAVGVDYIKRYLSDLDLGDKDPWRPTLAPPNGKKVAVVGAGPAGLSCAYYLALRGYKVTMFEAQPEAGGMLRYGIPEYRLPKDVLDLEINQILDLGVQLSTNVQLGRDFTVASLKQGGYDAIFLGLGAWDSSKMRVEDEDSPGVLAGIDFLRQFGLKRRIDIHGRVLVVGGGNTAVDCARTALRLGVAEVRILYRRTRKEMPANETEIVEAEREGVKMDFLVAPVRVLRGENGRVAGVECIRMELGEPDQSGRRSPRPVRGSEFRIDCDFVLAAIGQGTRVQGAGGRAGAQLPAPRRVAEPHALADRGGQRAHLRDHRGRSVLGGRRGHGSGHRDRGHRRRTQGRLRHRPLRGHWPGRARAGGGVQPQGRLPQGRGRGPAPRLRPTGGGACPCSRPRSAPSASPRWRPGTAARTCAGRRRAAWSAAAPLSSPAISGATPPSTGPTCRRSWARPSSTPSTGATRCWCSTPTSACCAAAACASAASSWGWPPTASSTAASTPWSSPPWATPCSTPSA